VQAPVSVMDTVKTESLPPLPAVPNASSAPAKLDTPPPAPAQGDSRAKDIPK